MLQENPAARDASTTDDEPRACRSTARSATATAPESERPTTAGDATTRTRGTSSTATDDRRLRPTTSGSGSGDCDWGSATVQSDDDEFHPQQVAASTLRDHLIAAARACSTFRCATARSSPR